MRAVLPLLIVAACAAEPNGQGGPGGFPPTPVQVASVGEPSLQGSWSLTGEVRALARAELAAQVPGRIVAVEARVGDAVPAGAMLVRVDPAAARADVAAARGALEEARVNAKVAERQLTRLNRVGPGVVADAERVAAKGRKEGADALVLSAEARLQQAEVVLARHDVRAPFAGVVARRHVDPGDHAVAGEVVVDLISDGGVEVLVDGPAALLRDAAAGQAVTIGAEQPATITGVVPALDPATRTVRVRVVPDGPSTLVPGDVVGVAVPYTRSEGQVSVPRDALVDDPAGATVVKIEGDGHARVPVVVLASNASVALVASDALAPGDEVVVRGNERLRPGQPIVVQRTSDGAEAP